jgi:hypothetical protein
MFRLCFAFAMGLLASAVPASADAAYPWRATQSPVSRTLETTFAPPAGFQRVPAAQGSFAAWLRGLPLLPANAPVLLYNGLIKPRQDVHAAVVDIDTGAKDLQQCADAVMRLRAEWLRAAGRNGDIAFNDTGGGKPMRYVSYAAGDRPRVEGRSLTWSRSATPDQSYAGFRRYLDTVFTWAGTFSLEKELVPVALKDLAAGDVFIKGGFPGHAVLVMDVAVNSTGEKRFLLSQSFMPAQSLHILKTADLGASAWYALPREGEAFETPEWRFPPGSLKRWPKS